MPNTLNDLLTAAAEALRARDPETLERLRGHAANWMQTREEATAQIELLDAMIEAAYLLEE